MSAAPRTVALILAGGHGSRLWPLSTPQRPKPFRALFEREAAVARVVRQCQTWLGAADAIALCLGRAHLEAAADAIPTLAQHRLFVEERLEGTTVAIARAALAVLAERSDTVLVVLAADQRLTPDRALFAALDDAVAAARAGSHVVSVGVRPDRPSSDYGYMQLGRPLADAANAFAGEGYVEKPPPPLAARLFVAGRSLWNVGLFAFRVDTLVSALRRFVPELVTALERGEDPPRVYRSIDHELLERLRPEDPQRPAFVAARCTFEDLGNLGALASGPRDVRGNRVRGEAVVVDCDDCTVLCEPPRRLRVRGLRDVEIAMGSEGNMLFRRPRSRLEVHRCPDEEQVARLTTEVIVDTLREAIERRGHAVWIASTGRTMVKIHARLASHASRALDWNRVEVLQMDELLDVPEAETSRHFLCKHLLEPLGIGRHVLAGDDPLATMRELERRLRREPADLVVHGIGENGHLGLNEPGSPFDGEGGLVRLTEETRRPRGLATTRGVTLGLAALLAVPRSVLVACGPAKREALRRALYEPASPAIPASALQLHPATMVIADGRALGEPTSGDAW